MIGRMLLLALAACLPASAAAPGVTNPHGAPDGCASCHAPGPSPSKPGPALPIVATCRSCHPDADMHPVGMAPRVVHVPATWPLEDGQVTCATCHTEPAHGAEFATLDPPWHRGGPYERVTGLCYQCHDAASYTRSDPHHPATARDPKDPTCAACHSGVPEPGAPAADSRLRFPTEEACATCHAGDVHAGVVEHVGEEVEAGAALDLPLMARGRIVCWTCHEIHEPGPTGARPPERAEAFRNLALQDEWAEWNRPDLAWPGTTDPAHPPLLALSADDGTLCRACHGNGP